VSIALALDVASAKPAGKRPYFLDREVERVLAITMATVQELAVARQRVDTLERLLEAKGVLSRDEINAFRPDEDQAAERGLWMQEYLTRVLRIVQQEGEAITADAQGDVRSEDVAIEITAGA
jgi:predicted  nucleic acid-binding Zn-ribbon protein